MAECPDIGNGVAQTRWSGLKAACLLKKPFWKIFWRSSNTEANRCRLNEYRSPCVSNTGEVSKRKGNLGPMPPREVQPHTIGTPMRITNLKLHSDDYHNVLSATVGDFDLWFRFGRDATIRESVDPFVAAALLPAMLYGTDIEVEGAYAVSEPLLNNLAELQEVFSCWSKLFRVVRIHCMTSPVAPARNRVGTFFSGGLDSHFTFLRHRDSVTNLIVINGFDFEMPPEVFSKVLARVDDFGKACGVTTTPVETNFLAYERHTSYYTRRHSVRVSA